MRNNAIIFDLDGTLADITHRLHYIKHQGNPNWTAFQEACADDKLIPEIAMVARALHDAGNDILITTGRMNFVRPQTMKWLYQNEIPFETLWMRKDGDHRPDHVLKKEFLQAMRKQGLEPVLVFEDRQQVVDMWRAEGIRVCQVTKGDF